jgi:protein-disulfide isomerase
MKTITVFLTLFFLTLVAAPAQTTSNKRAATSPAKPAAPAAKPAGAESKLPSKEEVEASLKRSFGYDTSISWKLLDVRPSVIPGLVEVLVQFGQDFSRVYYSPETQQAIVGNLIPFGPNPYAPARAKLQAADGPARGPQTPVITMVEFSDLECPHCKAAQPILEKLAGDFPQVKYIFQQYPLPATMHPWAMKAALYSDCAGHANNQVFWKYIDSIFENQGSIALATADDKLKELATAAGLDAQKIAACAALPETEARVKKSMELGQSLNVTATPTVFINGRSVPGPANIPYDQLKALVQFEINHAGK